MSITELLQKGVVEAIKALYNEDITAEHITMNVTRKEFEGDYTIVVFPFTKIAKKAPLVIAQEIGEYLVANVPQVERFNVVQGFLNLLFSDWFWRDFLLEAAGNAAFGKQPANGRRVMIEYCSPNTNKPLHLGHIRNILLGWSCSRLHEAAGYEVVKVQVINNRGIAICKSMLAWQKFGNGTTPESAHLKSDHFVGDYYVLFEQKFQEEYREWQKSAAARTIFEEKRKPGQKEDEFFKEFKNLYFNSFSHLGREARDMLHQWEASDPVTLQLWERMNNWVYDGFEETFRKLGVHFDKYYYESDTYLLGKDIVEGGLEKGVFYKKDDGSIWANLSDIGLDQKVILRNDGTSVYITQDLGTAQIRYLDFGTEKMVYVVADEQNYHFQALFEILKQLGMSYADNLHHLSYGMVELPSGKMKSREGTVVDADDLIAEVLDEARREAGERGEITALPPEEQEEIIRRVAMAALKFHIIKVHPKKRMIFDPRESVDLQGQTGPHIQYAYVRIQSVLRKAGVLGGNLGEMQSKFSGNSGEIQSKFGGNTALAATYGPLQAQEKELVAHLYRFPETILAATQDYDPSHLANYCYELAKAFHRFFTDLSILKAESEAAKAFRLLLCGAVAHVLKTGMDLLGIEMPERM
jgi:arginyl-tRNA synthetase